MSAAHSSPPQEHTSRWSSQKPSSPVPLPDTPHRTPSLDGCRGLVSASPDRVGADGRRGVTDALRVEGVTGPNLARIPEVFRNWSSWVDVLRTEPG